MSQSILFPLGGGGSGSFGSFPREATSPRKTVAGTIVCPSCGGNVTAAQAETAGQSCPYCDTRLHFRTWAVAQRSANAVAAMSDQATCFFHPDKAFQSCCQRCGRFLCGLCDLQLGAEHVCPACFERGRASSATDNTKGGAHGAEWRYRDILYDSIAVSIGWCWIILWPMWVFALPSAIVLHVKFRKAPRNYLIPRSGWRFWMAYPGLLWLPLLIAAALLITRYFRRGA